MLCWLQIGFENMESIFERDGGAGKDRFELSNNRVTGLSHRWRQTPEKIENHEDRTCIHSSEE